MHPFVLFLLAIVTPFLLVMTLLVPSYLGMALAAYIAYSSGAGPNPLADRLLDVFYIIDVYSKLFAYWNDHRTTSDLLYYTLPVLALPLAGIGTAFWLTRWLSRKMRDVFHLSVSN